MFFDSIVYLVFFALVALIYWRLSFRYQNYFLLAASYFFYGWWDWRFLFLIGGSTLVDFLVSKKISESISTTQRKTLLVFSVILNLTFLGIFKYFNFFVESFFKIAAILGFEQIPTNLWYILLPPAISFYTFQEIAYIVDVYYRRLKPANSIVDYALFVSLFPHLIAGPIQRPSHLLPQVQLPRKWSSEKAYNGIMLILEGLLRKVVIADNCALIANAAFSGNLGKPNLFVFLLGTYAFAWQIYGDFSGYSNIARGSAQLMGFHFMVNFRQPYLAESLQDFWRRWHISLSSWLRDYLYIPLGGNRHGKFRNYINLILTMLLGGLWHGANWTFVIWGGIHGIGLSVERLFIEKIPFNSLEGFVLRWIRRIIIFHLVCIAWVFFRMPSLNDAVDQLSGIIIWEWLPVYGVALLFLSIHVLILFLIDLHLEVSGGEYVCEHLPLIQRVCIGIVLTSFIILFGANQQNAFIYFQF